ncbi:tudor domain-containing protein 5-like [Harmonia axyridis]|uniref:tudor domain-containing protein 5-like n=1 Tax=Harmonia axyridis TaxID=115357 RepID=UPI001E2785C3|nr:tudor domain-containing protein 5-like [Harmonia axyridis]
MQRSTLKAVVNRSTNQRSRSRFDDSYLNAVLRHNSVANIEFSESSEEKSFQKMYGFDISLKPGPNNIMIDRLYNRRKSIETTNKWSESDFEDINMYPIKNFFLDQEPENDRHLLPVRQEEKHEFNNDLNGHHSEIDHEEYHHCEPVIPDNIVWPGQKIEPIPVNNLFREGSTVYNVTVVSIEDPSKFWIAINYPELEESSKEMKKFYRENTAAYVIPVNLLIKNLYCVAELDGVYFRAVIVDCRKVAKKVKLFFIDFGIARKVDCGKIFFMRQCYSELPAQAIRTRLSDVEPPYEAMQWSDEACRNFINLALLQDFKVEIDEIDRFQNVINVRLINHHDVPMKMILVNDGHAIYKRMTQPNSRIKVSWFHHFPTFQELESCSVLWRFESHNFESSGLTTDYLYPQYFERKKTTKLLNKIEEMNKLAYGDFNVPSTPTKIEESIKRSVKEEEQEKFTEEFLRRMKIHSENEH